MTWRVGYNILGEPRTLRETHTEWTDAWLALQDLLGDSFAETYEELSDRDDAVRAAALAPVEEEFQVAVNGRVWWIDRDGDSE